MATAPQSSAAIYEAALFATWLESYLVGPGPVLDTSFTSGPVPTDAQSIDDCFSSTISSSGVPTDAQSIDDCFVSSTTSSSRPVPADA
ncbi:hypothetical protein OF83DRAFT_1180034 [Amylostereum chailletii]|nr:hypothetical protein OF83DRAFT_1180034 [Amylostereum chailletii]